MRLLFSALAALLLGCGSVDSGLRDVRFEVGGEGLTYVTASAMVAHGQKQAWQP